MPVIDFQGQKIRFPNGMPAGDIEAKLKSIAEIAKASAEAWHGDAIAGEYPAPPEPLEVVGIGEIVEALHGLAQCSVQAQQSMTQIVGALIESVNALVRESRKQHTEIIKALDKEPVIGPQTGFLFEVERDDDGKLLNIIAIPQEIEDGNG